MDEAMKVLGKRAVAAKRWAWMAGMFGMGTIAAGDGIQGGWFIDHLDDGKPLVAQNRKFKTRKVCWYHLQNATPLLEHPATIGCLRARVRDLYNARAVWVELHAAALAGKPDVYIAVGAFSAGSAAQKPITLKSLGKGTTEAEALVAALEGAP